MNLRIKPEYLPAMLVLILSYFTYVYGISSPARLLWDESYHIPTAQRYLNGVFLQENHPPLGKLLIALGEHLYKGNFRNDEFVDQEVVRKLPANFNFAGYRIFPVLFAWMAALIFYLLMKEILSNNWKAFWLSTLYIFENAFITHYRAAMLDGIQMFFLLLCLLIYVKAYKAEKISYGSVLLLGLFFGFALNTKINALLISPLLLAPVWIQRKSFKKVILTALLLLFGVGAATISVWSPAIMLSKKINPKMDNLGYFEVSSELKKELDAGVKLNPYTLYLFIKDHFHFSKIYNLQTFPANLCASGTMGSHPLLWPLGGKSVKYNWQRDGNITKFIYLTPNLLSWFSGLVGLIIGVAIIICRLAGFCQDKIKMESLLLFSLLQYFLYMYSVTLMPREFYLYHYFIPQMFCFIMLAIVIANLKFSGDVNFFGKKYDKILAGMTVHGTLVFAGFLFMYPFSYFKPISDEEIDSRRIFNVSDLTCPGCPSTNPIARPMPNKSEFRTMAEWKFKIGDLASGYVFQSVGRPRVNETVKGEEILVDGKVYENGFGVQAFSRVDFFISKKYRLFKAIVALPDYLKRDSVGSVVFKVSLDNKEIWNSGLMKYNDSPRPIELNISNARVLTLEVNDGADGNKMDHALWLNPELIK